MEPFVPLDPALADLASGGDFSTLVSVEGTTESRVRIELYRDVDDQGGQQDEETPTLTLLRTLCAVFGLGDPEALAREEGGVIVVLDPAGVEIHTLQRSLGSWALGDVPAPLRSIVEGSATRSDAWPVGSAP